MINTTYFGVQQMQKTLTQEGGLLHDNRQPMAAVVLPLTKIAREFSTAMQDLQTAQRKLVGRYLEKDEMTDEAITALFQEDEEFAEEWKDLMNAEVEIDTDLIDPEALVGVSAATILALSPIMK